MGIFDGKKSDTKKSNEEIQEQIENWLEDREVLLDDASIKHYISKLFFAVKKERLAYDDSARSFKYMLLSPIKNADGENVVTIINIKSANLQNKKELSKQKDAIEQNIKMIKAYCTDSSGKEIEEGFLGRIEDDDYIVIQNVILCFFLKATYTIPTTKE